MYKLLPLLLLSLVATCGAPAHADQLFDKYVVHVSSSHPDFMRDMNEMNFGLGLRIEDYMNVDNLDYQFGMYQNSYGNVSAYSVFDLTADNGLGVFLGVATGYNEAHTFDNGQTVVGGIVYQMEYVTIRATPAYDLETGEKGVVLGFSITGDF